MKYENIWILLLVGVVAGFLLGETLRYLGIDEAKRIERVHQQLEFTPHETHK
jgi:hypothetical protein